MQAQVNIYCKNHHEPQNGKLCPACSSFVGYACGRSDKCHFYQAKKGNSEKLSEHRKNELELMNCAEKYRYLVEYEPTGICEINYNELKFESVNGATCIIFGFTEKELLAMSPFDIPYPESNKSLRQEITKGLMGKKFKFPLNIAQKQSMAVKFGAL